MPATSARQRARLSDIAAGRTASTTTGARPGAPPTPPGNTRHDSPRPGTPPPARLTPAGPAWDITTIVPGTKALHHVLPDLVPSMDRAWTGA